MDQSESRMCKALGTTEVPPVDDQYLAKYREFLLNNLDLKQVLTGREDFPWEEFYIFGPGDPNEYEKLKKEQASYTDEYYLEGISNDIDDNDDLIATVLRIADGKRFSLELSLLEAKDNKSASYTHLDDFSIWVVNWC